LKNLVLASNNLTELSDLDVLGKFAYLVHLVLLDNPVTKKEVSGKKGWVYCDMILVADFATSTIDIGFSGAARLCDS
jgi:hypothetical protein